MQKTAVALWLGSLPVFAGALVGCGGSGLTVASAWLDPPVTVDGDPAEWDGALTPVTDLHGSFAARNDDSTLAVCVVVEDRALQRQILLAGMTVWFDASGGREKSFGVRYPVGMEEGWLPGRGGEPDSLARERLRAAIDQELSEFEIIGPGKYDRMRYGVHEVPDITARINQAHGLMTLELEIPLDADASRFALTPAQGKPISVGLECRPRHGYGGGYRQGGPPGGGPGGEGGGIEGPGGFGGMRGRPPGEAPLDLEVWVSVPVAGRTKG